MHEDVVDDHQPAGSFAQTQREVVVLATAETELLVEAADDPEGIGADSEAEAAEALRRRASAGAVEPPEPGEVVDAGSIRHLVRTVDELLAVRHIGAWTGSDDVGVVERLE